MFLYGSPYSRPDVRPLLKDLGGTPYQTGSKGWVPGWYTIVSRAQALTWDDHYDKDYECSIPITFALEVFAPDDVYHVFKHLRGWLYRNGHWAARPLAEEKLSLALADLTEGRSHHGLCLERGRVNYQSYLENPLCPAELRTISGNYVGASQKWVGWSPWQAPPPWRERVQKCGRPFTYLRS